MSLTTIGTRLRLTGPRGTFECTWALFSLFRDNVQHHVEGGSPSGMFPALHAVADVIGALGPTEVRATWIRDETERVWRALRYLPIHDIAMSKRSAAVLEGTWPLPAVSGTALVRVSEWSLPAEFAGATILGNLFRPLVSKLLWITVETTKADVVRVVPIVQGTVPSSRVARNVREGPISGTASRAANGASGSSASRGRG